MIALTRIGQYTTPPLSPYPSHTRPLSRRITITRRRKSRSRRQHRKCQANQDRGICIRRRRRLPFRARTSRTRRIHPVEPYWVDTVERASTITLITRLRRPRCRNRCGYLGRLRTPLCPPSLIYLRPAARPHCRGRRHCRRLRTTMPC